MSTLEVTRADLEWLIKATLPHAGSKAKGLDWLGFEVMRGGRLHCFATDRYTTGMARVDCAADPRAKFTLPQNEAADLMRFVRPSRKADADHLVRLVVRGTELHVGLVAPEWSQNEPPQKTEALSAPPRVNTPATNSGGSILTSEVYDLQQSPVDLGLMLRLTADLATCAVSAAQLALNPDIAARFGKAKRGDEAMIAYPLWLAHSQSTGLLVTVGPDFIGSVAGISEPFITDALEGWGLTLGEQESAA